MFVFRLHLVEAWLSVSCPALSTGAGTAAAGWRGGANPGPASQASRLTVRIVNCAAARGCSRPDYVAAVDRVSKQALPLQHSRTKVETADLQLGMYVAQLDRPWLETPFLFQGFEIRELSELRLLRKFCQHVYIDVAQGSLPQDKLAQALKPKPQDITFTRQRAVQSHPRTLAGRLMRVITRFDSTGRIAALFGAQRAYRNQVPTQVEAPQAIRAYDSAIAAMTEVLAHLRSGAGIDVEQVEKAVTPLIDSVLRNQDAMAWLVYLRKRDEYAYQHSIATSVWAVILGRQLGFDRAGLDTLAMGGMLLDVGKAKLPVEVTQRPGALSEAEHQLMQRHVPLGLQMIKLTPGINADVLAMVEGHHERADGSGYPKGLKGADVPVYARIAGLIDCYDAMTSHRPWARAKSAYDAIRELNGLAGLQFQKEMVEQFVQAMGMFPTGSVVELNSGEIGIVIEQNRVRRLRPKVMLVLDAEKKPLAEYRTIDLRRCESDENQPGAVWIVRGLEAGAFGLDPKNYFMG